MEGQFTKKNSHNQDKSQITREKNFLWKDNLQNLFSILAQSHITKDNYFL